MKFLKNNAFLLFLGISVIMAGGCLMVVSQKVYDRQKNVQALDEDILAKQWNIRALKAELAYLSRPDRIEQITTAIAQSEPLPQGQSGIALVSYHIAEDLPAGMSLLPPQKPVNAVYHKPKAVQKVQVSSPVVRPQLAEKTALVEPVNREPQPAPKSGGFASLIDTLGGAR
tara:strand:- start:1429 stop:1941 length:513 start_codon:yes stop_codon:yes gene_type:complete